MFLCSVAPLSLILWSGLYHKFIFKQIRDIAKWIKLLFKSTYMVAVVQNLTLMFFLVLNKHFHNNTIKRLSDVWIKHCDRKKKNKLWIHEISAEGFTLSAEE